MQSNLLRIREPVTIIGDIHGQFYDLQSLLSKVPKITASSKEKLLFLGDYVDRGNFSIEVIIRILGMKINTPKNIFLLRGNHECRQLTTHFNFRNQCLSYYGQQIYEEFMELFDKLPLAAIVNNSLLCIHGGISTNMNKIEDILKIDRYRQIPKSGLFCDLLWADPIDNEQGKIDDGLVIFNKDRGCSYNYGYQFTNRLLSQNKLNCMIRAHQAKQQGYQMHHWAGKQKFPPVITIFSAPNYCDFYNNKGAFLTINKNSIIIAQIQQSSHPFYLPQDQTLFEWSIPYIAEKVSEIFFYLLQSESDQKKENILEDKDDQIDIMIIDRAKIIEQLLGMQSEEVEQSTQIMKIYGQGKTLGQQLINNKDARKYYSDCQYDEKGFKIQKMIDRLNEMRPEKSTIQE